MRRCKKKFCSNVLFRRKKTGIYWSGGGESFPILPLSPENKSLATFLSTWKTMNVVVEMWGHRNTFPHLAQNVSFARHFAQFVLNGSMGLNYF